MIEQEQGGNKMKDILNNTRKLTFLGVMLALTIAFVAITALPTASASMALLIFIPTIVTSIVMGPKAGALMGFCAGVTTLLRGLLAPLSPFDLFFINPLVSVLPRIFIGVVPYYIYKLLNALFKNSSNCRVGRSIFQNSIIIYNFFQCYFGSSSGCSAYISSSACIQKNLQIRRTQCF
jgi:uncharacterized membrane protein